MPGTPGLAGATIPTACFPGGTTQDQANSAFTALFPAGTPWQTVKVYFNAGSYPAQVNTGNVGSYAAQGIQCVLCFKPPFLGLPSTTYPTDLAALEKTLQIYSGLKPSIYNGPPVKAIVVLWQECQNKKNNMSASQYINCVKYYGPTIRKYYPLYYDSNGQAESNQSPYFPGPGNTWVDGVGIDYYEAHWLPVNLGGPGVTLATMDGIARSNGLPLAIFEWGINTTVPVQAANYPAYVEYMQSIMAARLSSNLVNGPIIWYNGCPAIGQLCNMMTPGDPRIGSPAVPGTYTWFYSTLTAPPPPPPPPQGGGQPLVIPFFPAGYPPGPGDLTNWVTNPLSFLTNKVVFRAELSSALTLPPGQNTGPLPFNVITEDPFGGWNATTNSWLCPTGMSGTYLVTITGATQAAADNTSTLQPAVALNGTVGYTMDNIWPPSSQIGVASGSVPMQISGGQDSLSAYLWWNGTASTTVSTLTGRRCSMEISWMHL